MVSDGVTATIASMIPAANPANVGTVNDEISAEILLSSSLT
jgi:hypothetical protein